MIGSPRLEPGQAPKAFAFAGLGFLLQLGLVLGITTADSLFLSHVGPAGLPAFYILQTLVMLLHTAAFVTLVKRFGIDRLFDGALAVMAIAGAAIWLAFADAWADQPEALYYAIKLYTGMWYFGLYTLFWTFLDSYYDLTDAKRLYALFAAGGAAGAMVGGGLVSLLAVRLGAGTFFLLWAVLAAATWPVLTSIRRSWRKIDVGENLVEQGSAFREALAGVKSLGESRYAVALTAGFFMIAVTATVCDYEYMRVFSEGRGEAELATLFGRVTLVANLTNMLITLLLFNPLVARFGVRNLALLQPLVFGGVFLWFVGAAGMGAAVAGFLAYHAIMMAIDINNGNLLVFGLPAARRKELRTFIEGICLPAAAASAGLFLLFVAPGMSLQSVALLGLASATVTFAFNLIVRQDYVGAIAANLRAGWLDLSVLRPRRQADVVTMGLLSPTSIADVLLRTAGDYTPSQQRLAEHLIVAMGPAAIPDLVTVSESRSHSVRARSVALRALGKLDFARLRTIAGPLMLRTAERAFEFLGRYAALERSGAQDAGSAVLRRINRDYPLFTLEIVLEALTVAGRLPPYEAIAVALNGGPSRDRGFAVETVEQAAGRPLARLLVPWIAGWAPDRQLGYAREQGLLPAMNEHEALDRAMTSPFPLEAAAAGQALWERGEPQPLTEKLKATTHPILVETGRVLLAREAGEDAGLTPIECVEAVMRVPELGMFRFVHLEWLARLLSTAWIAAGEHLAEEGGPLDRAWIVVEGDILVLCGGKQRVIGPGAIAGARALTGERLSGEQITAGSGLRVISLPRVDVLACGEAFQELGIELLRWKLAR